MDLTSFMLDFVKDKVRQVHHIQVMKGMEKTVN